MTTRRDSAWRSCSGASILFSVRQRRDHSQPCESPGNGLDEDSGSRTHSQRLGLRRWDGTCANSDDNLQTRAARPRQAPARPPAYHPTPGRRLGRRPQPRRIAGSTGPRTFSPPARVRRAYMDHEYPGTGVRVAQPDLTRHGTGLRPSRCRWNHSNPWQRPCRRPGRRIPSSYCEVKRYRVFRAPRN